MKFHTILFDAIGTTILEENGDVIMECFKTVFKDHTGSVDMELLRNNRGKDKKAMILTMLDHHHFPHTLLEPIYTGFKSELERNLHRFSPNQGAAEVFIYVKKKNINLGIGTGLERDIFEKLYNHFGWSKYSFDYIGCSPDLGHSRPHPAMIFDMMRKTGNHGHEGFLKIGDTAADIAEGKNAGVSTAVILSGSQDEKILLKESPALVIKSLMELTRIL